MKLILRFLKPHWRLCLFTILFMVIDVIGVLIIPTFAAEMLNQGTTEGADFTVLVNTCGKMLVAALISGVATILGAYVCLDLTSKVGADIRSALYKKTLCLAGCDFRSFGTGISQGPDDGYGSAWNFAHYCDCCGNYAKTAIKVNKRFAILDSISFFAINMFDYTHSMGKEDADMFLEYI